MLSVLQNIFQAALTILYSVTMYSQILFTFYQKYFIYRHIYYLQNIL